MAGINPNEVYTTNEARVFLRVSNSTIKRLLKRGLIRANKVGGQYRIVGKELLRLVSPRLERKIISAYQRTKRGIKTKTRNW